MSKKRYVDTRFWSDTWVMDSLSQLDRLLYLYLLTNDKTNVAGVYEISLKTIMLETDFSKDELMMMLPKLKSRVIYSGGWVVLRKAIKHQNYHNSKIELGIIAALSKSPQELLQYVDLPKDANVIKKFIKGHLTDDNRLQLDDLSMSHRDPSHLDIDIDSDLDIDLDLDAGLQESKKRLAPELRKSYALAVRADEQLNKKEANARGRPRGYETFAKMGEALKKRNIVKETTE